MSHSEVYVPGVWKCAKCNFRLVQANLNANTGTVTARDEPGDKCPNCDSPLWRVTWKQEAEENLAIGEQQVARAVAAEARIQQLEGETERLRAERDNWCKAYDTAMEMHALAEKEAAEEYDRSRELRERISKADRIMCEQVNAMNKQAARIQQLEAALEPFAEAGRLLPVDFDDEDFVGEVDISTAEDPDVGLPLEAAAFRRAASAQAIREAG